MNIGPPVEVSLHKDEDDGEICAEFYDAQGLCCGSVSFMTNGQVVAILLSGNNKVIVSETFDTNEE